MAPVRFNPTATAIQFDGNNWSEVQELMQQQTGRAFIVARPIPGSYYIAFMGDVHSMTERQFHAAQGLV